MDDGESTFDLNGFERMSRGFASLHGCLPESALNVLAREVIARLAAQRGALRDEAAHPADPALIDTFCDALIGNAPNAAIDRITALRSNGATIDQVYLGVLAPAARRLGTWWDESRASFAEVTIGVARIYGIMYALRAEFPLPVDFERRRAAFASVPGEDHTLGVSMAADLFRKEGWEIDLKLGHDHDGLVQALAIGDSPIIGLSAGREEALPGLIRLIVALRVSNPRAYILVAGRYVAAHADTLALTGADAAASEVPEALAAMDLLWERAMADIVTRAAAADEPLRRKT
ncbi:hypothetical protein DKT77_10610 [Meridianimarinicoccus roseus]|jgi:methanogenic corrinoid protein MtbC1|uniref:B12-binding domain-containing protein n=1 Tax=Meridianimarinicoccus roseus TaxID=2072018 RepID=A0A2V2LHG8_9RHOB|nr:hypothetical protein DKT77_10610 [Meridianimarinicoccus roseus]